MSPLWRDRIQVFLAPGRIGLVRSTRGFKPVQAAKVTVWCEPAQDAPVWQTALQQLEKHLMDAAGAQLSVTLSNHFVRYVALLPQTEIATPEEVSSYAAFRMREVYAERVNSWALSVSEWTPLSGAVCAAIPRDLMVQLEEMAARCRCTLKEIEPYFASVYDHWQKLLDGNKTYFAVIEAGRICLAVLINGSWHSIRNQRILHNVAAELLAALDQEAILTGSKEAVERVHVFAPEHADLTLPEQCGWCIVPMPVGKIPVLPHYPSGPLDDDGVNRCHA
ncbi:MAG: hypothetical protein LZF85_01890 [Nitrosomonas sp.]|uniref:hypothetical protein n=1 Tax=Nitrosomonas sp. TaxID=42353 RepID=UPI0025EB5539|nr:hypothetical protein [Nitrosomonas sp.]UJP03232.1 MAG: hypothetical protein LZF85_01890 [Nitrosomonas sp.]